MWNALDSVGLLETVSGLDHGLDSMIGGDGGGKAQTSGAVLSSG